MKKCFKCGVEKPLSEFYKHSGMLDGHLNKCKECTKKDAAENREDKRDYYSEYDRNRPNRVERNQKQNAKVWEKYHSDPEYAIKIQMSKSEWAERNPEKRKAHHAVNNAVRDGRLVKSCVCEHCGVASDRIQAHHWSYESEHWLDVIWLCPSCHGEEHRRLNGLGRCPDSYHLNPTIHRVV